MDGRILNLWGGRTPRQPAAGAGRRALVKRARSRKAAAHGGGERRSAVRAARRGLRRTRVRKGARGRAGASVLQGAAAHLRRYGQLFEQAFLVRKRLRVVVLALAAVWVLWTFGIGDAGLPRLWIVRHRNAGLRAEIEELAQHEAALREEVEALADPENLEAAERVARERHGVVRKGEVLVHFYKGEMEKQ